MFQVRRRGQATYEDLLQELEGIEQQLLTENSSVAMSLMVLEAKLRERFQRMDRHLMESLPFTDDDLFLSDPMDPNDIRALIPKDLPPFPSLEEVQSRRRWKRTFETAGIAAALALLTALGVFGLASILQLTLSWIA